MNKKRLIFVQVLIVVILMSTCVFATLNTTISLTQSATKVNRGDKVTVRLSLKDVDSSNKVTSVSGYINYNKDVIEEVTVDNIQKDSDGKVKIGNETLDVEDLTNATIDNMPTSDAYVGFNSKPTSGNDIRLVIDFKNGIDSDTELLTIEYTVKDDATIGEITNAISYKMFVVSSSSDQSAEITRNVDLTIQDNSGGGETPTDKTLSSIDVTKAPTKTSYTAGEKFDKSGMVVKATYSDGTTKEITGYSYTPSGALSTSDSKVTISYTEGGVTKTATQAITVKSSSGDDTSGKTLSSITITKAPTKTSYTAGEKFDKSGMVITAKYSDGTTKEITDYSYTPSGALSTSDSKITISYKEGNVTKTVTQGITVKASGNADGNNNGSNGSANKSGTSGTSSNGSKDNTLSTSKLPSTGAKLMILPMIVLIVIACISYKKYRKYKDI